MFNLLFAWLKKHILYIAWLQAFIATAGSLFFSEIIKLPVCSLCWYQRIFMYPLVLIIAVGMLKKDRHLPAYVLPLSILGMIIAFYLYLIEMRIIPEIFVPCSTGIPCTTKYFQWLGFITIPFLSGAAFTIINFCLIVYWRTTNSQPKK